MKESNPQIHCWSGLFSISLFIYLFIDLLIYLLIYLFIYLFIYLCIYLIIDSLVFWLRIGLFICSAGLKVVSQSRHLLKDCNQQIQCWGDLFSCSLFTYLFIYLFIYLLFQLLNLKLSFLSGAYLKVVNLAQFGIAGRS